MSKTKRKEILNTDNKILKALLKKKLKTLISVSKGYFIYQFKVSNRDILLEFKFDDVSNIDFSQNTPVSKIIQYCDCLSIDDITEKDAIETLAYFMYDGDN